MVGEKGRSWLGMGLDLRVVQKDWESFCGGIFRSSFRCLILEYFRVKKN